MISALAFGYGVGMAAPEDALDKMRHAVGGAETAPAHASARGHERRAPGAQSRRLPSDGFETGLSGGSAALGRWRDEPDRLAALRRRAASGHAASGAARDDAAGATSFEADLGDGGDTFRDTDRLDDTTQEALSRLHLPDLRVPITRKALAYVRFLTRSERGRDMFETWLKRSGRFQDVIQQQLREWALPEDLMWVAMIESGFDPRAKSPAGAVGLWQFMRSTGEVYDLLVNKYVDERKNPVKATRAAAHHLRDLYQRFGSWDLALAAYNMGYEQLLAAIDRAGTTDFWELARQRVLPSETSAYVPKIVAAALVANNLERYGFDDVRVLKPWSASEMGVPPGTSLRMIARAADIGQDELRKLNPHLLGSVVPPGEGSYQIFLPNDSLPRVQAALPAMLTDKHAYRDAAALDPVDVLDAASRRRAWDEDESLLAQLPKPKRRSLRAVLQDRDDPLGAESLGGQEAEERLADELDPVRRGRETVMYRVGPGDTLIGVAKQFAVDPDDVARDNGLAPGAELKEGALVKVSVKKEVLARFRTRRGEAPAVSAPRADDGDALAPTKPGKTARRKGHDKS
ncbi:MAG: transglycosylase SLT domain-containing protein [Polyangiaceae bacterium]|nr:transglycosylase SLT domain-containing protein [Polyangiaceae bacterium]